MPMLLKQVLYPGDRNLRDFGGTFMALAAEVEIRQGP